MHSAAAAVCTIRWRLVEQHTAAARVFADAATAASRADRMALLEGGNMIRQILAARAECRRIRAELLAHREEHGC